MADTTPMLQMGEDLRGRFVKGATLAGCPDDIMEAARKACGAGGVYIDHRTVDRVVVRVARALMEERERQSHSSPTVGDR